MNVYFSDDFFGVKEENNDDWVKGCMEYRYGLWRDQSKEVKEWYENFVKRKTEVKIDWFDLLKKADIKFDPKFVLSFDKREIVKMWWDGSDWEKSFNDFVFNMLSECDISKSFTEDVSGLDIVEFVNDDEVGFECEDIEDFIDKCEITFEESLEYYFTGYIEWISNSEQTTPLTRVLNMVLKIINYNVGEDIIMWKYDNKESLDTLLKVSGINDKFVRLNYPHETGFGSNILKIENEDLIDCIDWKEI